MTVLSIDGSFALHRARSVAGKNGTPTRDHTLVIFMQILIRTCLQFAPTHVYIYFDRERSYHRLELYPEYKGHRKEVQNDLTLIAYKEARAFLVSALPPLGFVTILQDGIEADDFGYLIAHTYQHHTGIHVTDDRDWFANIFESWSLYRPKAREFISYRQFCDLVSDTEKPRMIYLIARAIVGDKSDNIPGIKGVPWKQALILAPHILAGRDLGEGPYADKIRDKLKFIWDNVHLMTPIWVLRSDEAWATLEDAEHLVSTDHTQPFQVWRNFYGLINAECQRELMRLTMDYNSIAMGMACPLAKE